MAFFIADTYKIYASKRIKTILLCAVKYDGKNAAG
jgi:hypothetical protein